MWTCPECGDSPSGERDEHGCVALERYLARKSEHARALFRRFEAVVRGHGEARLAVEKTRLAFHGKVCFCSIRLARRWADVSFLTSTPVGHPRVLGIEMYGAATFDHHVRVTDPSDIDVMLSDWIEMAHRRGGQTGVSAAPVPRIEGPALELLRVPLRASVVVALPLALKVPAYVFDTLGERAVLATMGTAPAALGALVRDGEEGRVIFESNVLEELGLAAGGKTDLFLAAHVG